MPHIQRPELPYRLHPECCWPYRADKVAEYIDQLRAGECPPPITLCDGLLLDGVHRLEAWIAVHGNAGAIPTEELAPGRDPGEFVYVQHQGTRELSTSEMAAQVIARSNRTGKSIRECLALVRKTRRQVVANRAEQILGARPPKDPKPRARAGSYVRLIVPDSHGEHIDLAARDACVADAKRLDPKEVVLLGDHLDCGGFLSAHQRSYTKEMTESYAADCKAANTFLDLLQKAAPRATFHYLEGNHEFHVERWASREIPCAADAVDLVERLGPEAVLGLKRRGIQYYRQGVQYMDLPIPGTIKLGKCFFTHGSRASKHASAAHVDMFAGNVVHGHTHRSQAYIKRTVSNGIVGGWCPGALVKLQMLYNHNGLTDWSHGFGVQFVEKNGNFMHLNVPIFEGRSLLQAFLSRTA